ncbi:MAG: hypothetical protein ACXWLH_03835 [Candidatus Saccharimonadales bacterium]
MKLVFKPRLFFRDLERITKHPKQNLQSSLSKAIRNGLIKRVDGIPVLTENGFKKIRPYTAHKLKKDVCLMVAFDIPERIGYKRRQLRAFLRFHGFEQAQKSLWISDLDFRKELKLLIKELDIEEHVSIYESAKL